MKQTVEEAAKEYAKQFIIPEQPIFSEKLTGEAIKHFKAGWAASLPTNSIPYTALRESIVQLMKGDEMFAKHDMEESTNFYYAAKIVSYKNVLELIDAGKPLPSAPTEK